MAYRREIKYFILGEAGNNPFPRIENWSRILDVRKLNRDSFQELPDFFLLEMSLGFDVFFPDIITFPFLLMSREAMEVVTLYDPDIPLRFTALFDPGRSECVSYFCPVLAEEDCVAGKLSPGTGMGEIRLDRRKLSGFPLFCIRIRESRKAVMRMDLAESLLRRDAVGLQLEEIFLTD